MAVNTKVNYGSAGIDDFAEPMSLHDAAKELGVSPATLRRWGQSGKATIRHRIGQGLILDGAEVKRLKAGDPIVELAAHEVLWEQRAQLREQFGGSKRAFLGLVRSRKQRGLPVYDKNDLVLMD